MSYCRWSSVCEDNFDSDLYIFGHVDGYIAIHIAASRLAGAELAPVVPTTNDPIANVERYVARRRWLEKMAGNMVPIELPHAGESFRFAYDDTQACEQFLRDLKKLGYHMPDYVLQPGVFQ